MPRETILVGDCSDRENKGDENLVSQALQNIAREHFYLTPLRTLTELAYLNSLGNLTEGKGDGGSQQPVCGSQQPATYPINWLTDFSKVLTHEPTECLI